MKTVANQCKSSEKKKSIKKEEMELRVTIFLIDHTRQNVLIRTRDYQKNYENEYWENGSYLAETNYESKSSI